MKRFRIYFALQPFSLANFPPLFCFFDCTRMNEVEMRIHSECASIGRSFWVKRFRFGAVCDWCGLGSSWVFQVLYFAKDCLASLIIILRNLAGFLKISCSWCWCSRCRCFGSSMLSGKMFFFWGETEKDVLFLKHDIIFYLHVFSLEKLLLVF